MLRINYFYRIKKEPNNILTKNTDKLKHITAESLLYSVFAVSNGKYYDRKSEVYVSKFLKCSLNINDYMK